MEDRVKGKVVLWELGKRETEMEERKWEELMGEGKCERKRGIVKRRMMK